MFGWDEYWDTRSGWGYGPSQVAKDLSIMLKSQSFQNTLGKNRRQLNNQRVLAGVNDQCQASYAKDWTLGGKMEGGTWKNNCGCYKVPYKTQHTDVLGCIDAWATEKGTTTCARIKTNTDDTDLTSTALTESTASGEQVVDVEILPQRLAFELKITFHKIWTCQDIVKVEDTLRSMLGQQHTNSYKALGYAATSKTATKCNLSVLNTQYGDSTMRLSQCDSALITQQDDITDTTKVSGGGRNSNHGRSLGDEENVKESKIVHVRATFQIAYPSVVVVTEDDASQYVGQQFASTEMIAQQLHTLDEANLITSQFMNLDGTLYVEKVIFVKGGIETGPNVNASYPRTTNTTVPVCEKDWTGSCNNGGVIWILVIVFGSFCCLFGIGYPLARKYGSGNGNSKADPNAPAVATVDIEMTPGQSTVDMMSNPMSK